MIPFTCPHCGLYTEVEDQYAGLTGNCYGCGKTITTPAILARPIGVGASPPLTATGAPASPSGGRSSAAVLATSIAAALIAVICLVGLGLWLLAPAVRFGRGVVARGQCRDNLARIGQALRNYEMEFGVLPPAYLADDTGKPVHSWRVLILPYLGYSDLYRRYDFAEPWDGPNNMALAGEMPPVYACPGDAGAAMNLETSYVVISGRGTMFPGGASSKSSYAVDGQAATLLVVESHATGITWTQPVDLPVNRMTMGVNSLVDGQLGGNHDDGANVATVDGSVHLAPSGTPAEAVEALITPNGGEASPAEYLDP